MSFGVRPCEAGSRANSAASASSRCRAAGSTKSSTLAAWDKGGTVTLANEPLNRRHGLAELKVHDTRMPRHESQEARGLGHAGQEQPTALAFGK